MNDGAPHLVSQLFVHDGEGAIFPYGARAGRAHDIVAGDGVTRACFTTSETGRHIPAEEPVNFTVEYASVVAHGTIDLVDGRPAKRGFSSG